ncbi:MAG: hypothetical protein LUG99_11360 [Lachnospiraceae bacterium]|nr:hypothetical protein [Lachnospiraceae bacterium]
MIGHECVNELIVDRLLPEHRSFLMQDLDGVISQKLQDKIWDMIWKRWCVYEDLRGD